MRRFLLINLFLSSFGTLLFFSCSPASGHKFVKATVVTSKEVQPIINKNNSLLYKASIDIYTQHFSGLIVLKQLDEHLSHLTFVTEIGMKIFDFEIRDSTFTLAYVFQPLDPRFAKILGEDLKLLLLQHLLNKPAREYQKNEERVYKVKHHYREYYTLNPEAQTVKKLTQKGTLFTKLKADYIYNDSLQATQIRLRHKSLLRLKIHLNKIEQPKTE